LFARCTRPGHNGALKVVCEPRAAGATRSAGAMPPAGLPPEIVKQPMLGVLFAFVPAGVDGGEAAALIARVVAQLDVRVAVLPQAVAEPDGEGTCFPTSGAVMSGSPVGQAAEPDGEGTCFPTSGAADKAFMEKVVGGNKVQTSSDCMGDMDDTEWLDGAEDCLRSGQCSVGDFSERELHRLHVCRARKSDEEAAAKEEEAAAQVQADNDVMDDVMDDTEWLEEAEGILRSGQCSVGDFSVDELHRLQVCRAKVGALARATEEQAAKKPKVYAGAG
jgi:hypothetical protein